MENSEKHSRSGTIHCEDGQIANFVKPAVVPKHFAIDLDGTFLAENAVAMHRNCETLVKAIEKGINVFFCTGRGFAGALSVLTNEVRERTNFTGFPGIYQNGAIVYGPDGTVLRAAHFRRDVLETIIDLVRKNNHENNVIFTSMAKWNILSDDIELFIKLGKDIGAVSPVCRVGVEDLMDETIMKIMVIDYEKVKDSFSSMHGVEFIARCSLNNMTDLTPPGITKASGLEVLLGELGVSTSDCGYMGDAENDLEAMGLVEHSFAVGNAQDAIKRAAKYVLRETNEECAFSVVMKAMYDI